jgi:hypothetical protein
MQTRSCQRMVSKSLKFFLAKARSYETKTSLMKKMSAFWDSLVDTDRLLPSVYSLIKEAKHRTSEMSVNFYQIRKSGPVTRHWGALGERRYSSYSFLTSALEGGEWSASRPGRALPPGKEPPVSTV